MALIYRPLLSSTQYCPCGWESKSLPSPPHSSQPSPFFRTLFAPYTPLWIDPAPATTDNSPDVEALSQQADINYRTTFERQQKSATKSIDATGLMASLYMPKGRWHWTYQVPFEDRSEEVPISSNRRYSLSIRTARMYNERITYMRKLWPRGLQWEGFFSEVWLHKGQLRPLHGIVTPALVGIHSNIDGIQMTHDIPHHSFWIQASPDMPIVLKRRCLDAYYQLHGQGVLHGSVDFANILIGGDGQVKLMNFEKSRSDKSESRVGLRSATPQDFMMEMREVHYKLNYLGAREKELDAWENRHSSRPVQPPSRNRGKNLYDRAPYTIPLEPPVDPSIWRTPDDWEPTRFVVPGQSVQQFEFHLNRFLLELDEPERRVKKKLPSASGPFPPAPPTPSRGQGPLEPLATNSRDPGNQGQRYNLRKRKREEIQPDDSDEDSSTKRVRFLAVTQHDDGTRGEVRPPLPPGVKRQVPRTPREYKNLRYPFAPSQRKIETKSIIYYPAPSPHSLCPEFLPRVNYEEFFSTWRSSCARSENHAKNRRGDGSEDGNSSRTLGKRRQPDDGDSPANDGRHPKRLRRSETTIWEVNSPETSLSARSTSEACRGTQPRRVTRASTQKLRRSSQLVAGPSMPLSKDSAEAPIQASPVNPRFDEVSRSTKRISASPPSNGSLSSLSEHLATSQLAEYEPRGAELGIATGMIARVDSSLPTFPPQTEGRPGKETLTSVTTSHGSTSTMCTKDQTHDCTSQVRETTDSQPRGRPLTITDSFESIPLVYDEPTQATHPPPAPLHCALTTIDPSTEILRSWQEPSPVETAPPVAGQLPSSIFTIANKIGGIFGLW